MSVERRIVDRGRVVYTHEGCSTMHTRERTARACAGEKK